MDLRERDVVLPWQLVLLGFLAFAAFFAGMLFVFSHIPAMEMRGSAYRFARGVCGPYLLGFAVVGPLLGWSGWRSLRRQRAAGDGATTIPMSPEKGIAAGVVVAVAGVMFLLIGLRADGEPISRLGPGVVVLISGISAIAYHLKRAG
jgi:hypothetical protein